MTRMSRNQTVDGGNKVGFWSRVVLAVAMLMAILATIAVAQEDVQPRKVQISNPLAHQPSGDSEKVVANTAAVLIQELTLPCHSTGASAMKCDLLDLGHHLDPVSEKDRRLELPIRQPHQRQRRDTRVFRTQARQDAQPQQTVGHRFAER